MVRAPIDRRIADFCCRAAAVSGRRAAERRLVGSGSGLSGRVAQLDIRSLSGSELLDPTLSMSGPQAKQDVGKARLSRGR